MPTFTYRNPGTHDPVTGTFTGATTTTYAGEAIEVTSGRQYERFAAAGRITDSSIVLLYTPPTYTEDSLPPVGSTVVWAGRTLTVASYLKVVRPDGVPILAYLECRR